MDPIKVVCILPGERVILNRLAQPSVLVFPPLQPIQSEAASGGVIGYPTNIFTVASCHLSAWIAEALHFSLHLLTLVALSCVSLRHSTPSDYLKHYAHILHPVRHRPFTSFYVLQSSDQ